MRARLALLLAIAAGAALFACARDDSPLSPAGHLAFGEWGGDRTSIGASVSSTSVWIGCMTGVFTGNIPLDAAGRFTADGTWNLSVGPALLHGNMPAQLSGQVSGRTVSFAVAVFDSTTNQVRSIGPQSAEFGKQGNVVVCPA